MTSTRSDETARARPWGASLAMAGAMAAGLAMGRKNKLALMAGIAAVAGIKWILRRNVMECAVPLESLKVQEQEPSAEVHAVTGKPLTDEVIVDEALPEIWEQGRNEPVSCSGGGAQTVWYEMAEPLAVMPALPALTEASALPESFFNLDPTVGLDPLPMVSANVQDAGFELVEFFKNTAPSGAADELSFFDPLPLIKKSPGLSEHAVAGSVEMEHILEELHRGPHRSVVPLAPIHDGRDGRMMKLATAVALVITVMAVALGVFQQAGWVQDLKHHWHVADRGTQESPANVMSASVMSPTLEK